MGAPSGEDWTEGGDGEGEFFGAEAESDSGEIPSEDNEIDGSSASGFGASNVMITGEGGDGVNGVDASSNAVSGLTGPNTQPDEYALQQQAWSGALKAIGASGKTWFDKLTQGTTLFAGPSFRSTAAGSGISNPLTWIVVVIIIAIIFLIVLFK